MVGDPYIFRLLVMSMINGHYVFIPVTCACAPKVIKREVCVSEDSFVDGDGDGPLLLVH